MKNTFLIATLLATTALAVNAYADELTCAGEGDSTCTWSYDATTKTLTITGTGSMKNFGPEGSITASQGVTYRAERPWNDISTEVEHVVVSGFTTIGARAFAAMSNLKSVNVIDSLQTINWGAFSSTSSLESVSLPSSLKTVGAWSFQTTGLQTISLPSGMTTIGNGAFRDATSLISVTIPDTVTSIEASAFGNISTLKSIVIPDSVTSLGKTVAWGVSGTIFCASSTLCSGDAMQYFSGTKKIYSIDENGVYKIGDTYYASAEDMSRVTCTGTAASTCSLSPVACTEGYDKCKENALSQMVAKGSLCTTIQGCQNLIAMVSDSNYNCTTLVTCRNAVKAGTYNVNLSEGAIVSSGSSTGIGKRIYTVEEARQAVEAAGTETVNFRIRYK